MTDRVVRQTPIEPLSRDIAPVRWYVTKTHPNGEQKASFHLQRQGFDVYLPRYLRRVSHARRISWQPRPLFPTYLFVSITGPDQRWRAINSTVGVAHLDLRRAWTGSAASRESSTPFRTKKTTVGSF